MLDSNIFIIVVNVNGTTSEAGATPWEEAPP